MSAQTENVNGKEKNVIWVKWPFHLCYPSLIRDVLHCRIIYCILDEKASFFPLLVCVWLVKTRNRLHHSKKEVLFFSLQHANASRASLHIIGWNALMVAMCFNQNTVCASPHNEKFPLTKWMQGFSVEFSAGFWCAINEDVAYKPQIMPSALLSCLKSGCLSERWPLIQSWKNTNITSQL